ncbi:YcaO-like family protein [Nonomuraea indica]|uniref:YcaO-like family protein n=1 Tax=Nonomuraea indica TaxID=1581193 RepID=UPI000C7D314D|nr:YcaO-like family protein [Nonomuraea indica]
MEGNTISNSAAEEISGRWAAARAQPIGKAYRDGTDRAVSPAATLARVSPAMTAAGITRVANVTGMDRIGIPVWCAVRPASRSLTVSQGKGVTGDAARASAVMESLELWHAETHHLPLRYDTHRALAASGEAVLDPMTLVRCPCSEYAADRPMRWVRGWDLVGGRPAWVPYEAVHCDWRVPVAPGDHAVQNGSNGLASGNSLLEATVHALCELVERDAIVAAQDAGDLLAARRMVRPETVADDACRDLLGRFRRAGVDVLVWDLTSEVGVPVFNCLAVETDTPWYHPLPQTQGSGCHPRRAIALSRALTEAAQARATVIVGSRDDIGRDRQSWYFDPEQRRAVGDAVRDRPERDYGQTPDLDHGTVNEDLDWLLTRLTTAGIGSAVVVDLTIPDLGVPVVKAVVPGLRWRPWEE